MDTDEIKSLKREIDLLRGELEHVFPEHEQHYNRLIRSIKEKVEKLQSLQPAVAPWQKHWWRNLLRK